MAGTVGCADPLKIFGTGGDFNRLYSTESAEFHANELRNNLKEVFKKRDDGGNNAYHTISVLQNMIFFEMDFEAAGHSVGSKGRDKAATRALDHLRAGLNILVRRWGLENKRETKG
jgi:hypothetical protein